MQLHKTDKARLELVKGTRTLGQRHRTLLLLADGRKTVTDFERHFGPAVLPTLQDLVENGYLVEKVPELTQAAVLAASAPRALVTPVTPVSLQAVPASFVRPIPGVVEPAKGGLAQSAAKPRTPTTVNLLIVDDSEVARRAMQNQLRPYAATVHLATSGAAALELLEEEEFDIVFLDIMMDDLDGYQTCRAIKQLKTKSGKLPAVVMQSSKGGVIDKIRGTMARADGYLTKPLRSGQVADVVRKFAPGAIDFTPSTV